MPPTRRPLGAMLLLALFATHPLVLLACSLLQLAPPDGLPSLATRPSWVYWVLVAAWAAAALLLALVVSTPWRLWRLAAVSLALLLIVAAGWGLWARLPLAWPMALSLAALAGLLGWLASVIGPREPMARKAQPRRVAADATSRPVQRWPRGAGMWLHLKQHAGFWLCSVLMVLFFALALTAKGDPQRGVGMLGMLLMFFIVLPAATLRAWMPRLACGLYTAAALGLFALALRSGLPQPLWSALTLLLLGWGPPLRMVLVARLARRAEGT